MIPWLIPALSAAGSLFGALGAGQKAKESSANEAYAVQAALANNQASNAQQLIQNLGNLAGNRAGLQLQFDPQVLWARSAMYGTPGATPQMSTSNSGRARAAWSASPALQQGMAKAFSPESTADLAQRRQGAIDQMAPEAINQALSGTFGMNASQALNAPNRLQYQKPSMGVMDWIGAGLGALGNAFAPKSLQDQILEEFLKDLKNKNTTTPGGAAPGSGGGSWSNPGD